MILGLVQCVKTNIDCQDFKKDSIYKIEKSSDNKVVLIDERGYDWTDWAMLPVTEDTLLLSRLNAYFGGAVCFKIYSSVDNFTDYWEYYYSLLTESELSDKYKILGNLNGNLAKKQRDIIDKIISKRRNDNGV